MNNAWYRGILACPDCTSAVAVSDGDISCPQCHFVAAGPQDLRPQRPRPLALRLSRLLEFDPDAVLRGISTVGPTITYRGPQAIRDSRELMSAIAEHLTQPGRILDLGCGPRDQEASVQHLGHQYVGVDIVSRQAHFLADAHALPFASGSFDCVLSYAVFQHMHNPLVAINEVGRVLKPGGIFVGTVAQGEPFAQSFFHPTSWGFLSLLAATGDLQPIRIWAAIDALASLARMGRYSRVIRKAIRFVHLVDRTCPFLAPRKLRWPQKDREIDAVYRAGSIAFVVKKSATASPLPAADRAGATA